MTFIPDGTISAIERQQILLPSVDINAAKNKLPDESKAYLNEFIEKGSLSIPKAKILIRDIGQLTQLTPSQKNILQGISKDLLSITAKDTSDPHIQILLEEINKHFISNVSFTSKKEFENKTEKFKKDLLLRLKTFEPTAFNEDTTLEKYFLKKGYYFSIDPIKLINKKTNQTEYALLISTNKLLHQAHIPEQVCFKNNLITTEDSSQNKLLVTIIGENIIEKHLENLKEHFGMSNLAIGGKTTGQSIVLSASVAAKIANEHDISERDAYKIIISNEIGNIFYLQLFGNHINTLDETHFTSTLDDKKYSFDQLSEAISDYTELRYGTNNPNLFYKLLTKEISNTNIVENYSFSLKLLSSLHSTTLKKLGITNPMPPENKLEEFKNIFLTDLNLILSKAITKTQKALKENNTKEIQIF